MYKELHIRKKMKLPFLYVGVGEYLLKGGWVMGERVNVEGVEITFENNPTRYRVTKEDILKCDTMEVTKNGNTVVLRMVPKKELQRI